MSTTPATPPPTAKAADPKAQVAQAPAKKTFQDLIDGPKFKEQILLALPKHLTVDRFIRVLMTSALKTPALLQCTQESLFNSIFSAAAAGLELDGRRAALVPLRNRKKAGNPLEANFWPMYQGIAELVMRSGVASTIHADVVHMEDVFDYDRGELKAHKVDFKKPRGAAYAAYCIIKMKDGTEKVEVMGKEEILAIQRKAPGGDGDAWRDNPGEMWKKTVFKRASKWVPLSPEVKAAIEQEHDDEPINVTQKVDLAGLIGAPSAQMTEAGVIEKMPLPDGAAIEPTVETKTYSAEERATILAAVQSAMLDHSVSEAKVMLFVHKEKLAKEGQDEVGSLDTVVLENLRVIIPTLKK